MVLRHARLIKHGLLTNPVFVSKLINDYVCCRSSASLHIAYQLFDQVPVKDTVLWTSLISAYVGSGHTQDAIELFSLMIRQSDSAIRPNHFVFSVVARAIASCPVHFQLGLSVHAYVLKSGFMSHNVILETALLDMYVKCGFLGCAWRLYDEMPCRNLVTWNAMISGHVRQGFEARGLQLFCQMKCCEFFVPDEFSIATVLLGCAWIQDLVLGLQVHAYAIVSGYDSCCVNSIVNMYFYCGQVSSAEKMLEGTNINVVSRLIKIRGYIFNHRYNDALQYAATEGNQIFYSDYTIIVPLLAACTKVSFLNGGQQLHGLFITFVSCLCNHVLVDDDFAIICCALIDMYCKCGSATEAQKVFDACLSPKHISLWNSMICGLIHNGLIEDARRLFDEMPEKSIVSCTSLISGYVKNAMPQEGLNLLVRMYSSKDGFGVEGNHMTFVVGLEACSYLTDLDRGKQIHAKMIRNLDNAAVSNVIVGTALVDMYSKSGWLNYAQIVFDFMLNKNIFAWTSIIMGYAINGFGIQALKKFQEMIGMGIEPNEVTFVVVLTACSHCGLVDKGLKYFRLMMDMYKIVPREDHLTCMIDMLGRDGKLEEAWSLLKEIEDKMGDEVCKTTILAAVLGACQLHGNVGIGSRVAEKMLENKQQVSTAYIALSNVYAGAEMWNEVYGARDSWHREDDHHVEPGLSRLCTNREVY